MKEITMSQRLNNPITLAGLAVLSGNDLGTALNSAATLSRQKQLEAQQKAQFEQQQYMRENIGQLMGQLNPNDLPGSFATLVKAGVPIPNASALVDSMRKQQAQAQTQQLLAGMFGGNAGGTQGVPGVPSVPGGDMGSIDATVGAGGDGSMLPRTQPGQSIAEAAAAGTQETPATGMGNPDPKRLIAAGLMTGNPMFVTAGNALASMNDRNLANTEGKPPAGFRKVGDRLEPIPGGPVQKKSPEVAAKITLINQGERLVSDVNSKLFGQNGRINNELLAGMLTNAPGTEGRQLRQKLKGAIRNKLRVESGASIGDEEAEAELEVYLPSVFDNEATKQDKLNRLQQYFTEARQTIDPNSTPKEETIPEGGNITPQDDIKARALQKLKERGVIQ